MLWVAQDKKCHDVQIGNEKIVEISHDWYIESALIDKEDNKLVLTIRKNEDKIEDKKSCEGCVHEAYNDALLYCELCSRKSVDKYKSKYETDI